MNTTKDTAELSRNHEVHVQAMVKALTAQRDTANNTVVNVLAEKAVTEDRLKRVMNELTAKTTELTTMEKLLTSAENDVDKFKSEVSQARVVILNLQSQLNEKNSNAGAQEMDETTEKKPSLVDRIVDACTPTRS